MIALCVFACGVWERDNAYLFALLKHGEIQFNTLTLTYFSTRTRTAKGLFSSFTQQCLIFWVCFWLFFKFYIWKFSSWGLSYVGCAPKKTLYLHTCIQLLAVLSLKRGVQLKFESVLNPQKRHGTAPGCVNVSRSGECWTELTSPCFREQTPHEGTVLNRFRKRVYVC